MFWNPGDAFATEAELLDPTEKEVRNPAIVKAFRRIGLSDQAGTGIRAIFRNWHELGRTPPQLKNDKARKEFELVLINKPLVTDAMQRFRQTIGTNLTPEQADVLALALEQAEDTRISLTDIRGLGIATTQQAKQIAEHLVRQQLLDAVSDTQFQVREALRLRFVAQGVTVAADRHNLRCTQMVSLQQALYRQDALLGDCSIQSKEVADLECIGQRASA